MPHDASCVKTSRPEDAFFDQLGTQPNTMRMVDGEHANRGTTDRGPTKQSRTVPVEVPRPRMTPGMKQSRVLARQRVDAGEIRAFVAIAPETGQSQIAGERPAFVSGGDDVVDLERQLIEPLSDPTVFAGIVRPPPDQSFERSFHDSLRTRGGGI